MVKPIRSPGLGGLATGIAGAKIRALKMKDLRREAHKMFFLREGISELGTDFQKEYKSWKPAEISSNITMKAEPPFAPRKSSHDFPVDFRVDMLESYGPRPLIASFYCTFCIARMSRDVWVTHASGH